VEALLELTPAFAIGKRKYRLFAGLTSRAFETVADLQAAGVGFEPTGDLSAACGFQDRPVRPLRHPAEDGA
jgi:hypothetical protein